MTNSSAALRREAAAAILIERGGNFLLQQRDHIVGILHPGKVGLFGGHREGDESFLACIAREIHEEIGYFIPPERFQYLTARHGVDPDVEGGTVHGEIFVARDIPLSELMITEGALLVVRPDDLGQLVQKLVPSARFALQAFGVLDRCV